MRLTRLGVYAALLVLTASIGNAAAVPNLLKNADFSRVGLHPFHTELAGEGKPGDSAAAA